jgi:hypothetical protein
VFSGLGTSVGFMLSEELHCAPNEGCHLAVRPPVRRQDAMLVSSLRSGQSAIREGVYVVILIEFCRSFGRMLT